VLLILLLPSHVIGLRIVFCLIMCFVYDCCVEDEVYPIIKNSVIIKVTYLTRCRRPDTILFT
jgi:hypothetical protein